MGDSLFSTDANGDPSRQIRRMAVKSLVQSLDEYTARHLTCTGEPTNNLEQRLQQWKHRFSSRVTQMFSLILEWQIQLEADPNADSKANQDNEALSVDAVSEVEIVGTFCEALIEL